MRAVVGLGMAATVILLPACREEPTIVIHFEPRDLAVAPPRAVQPATPPVIGDAAMAAGAVAGPPPDAAGAVAIAPTAPPTTPPAAKAKADARAEARSEHKGPSSGGAAECVADADCVTLKADCCGCNQGGRAQAVAKKRQAEVLRALERECGTMTMCVQMISTHPSCRGRAACRQHRCVLVD